MNQVEKKPFLDEMHRIFVEKYNTHGYDLDVNIARIVVSTFFIWKLLSRDYGFYGTVPSGVFPFYAINIYPLDSYVLLTGIPIISELATFHWIHFIIPYPNEWVLRFIQGLAITFLVLHVIFGRGPYRCISIGSYCTIVYLWGFLFIGGQEIDSILLYFGLLLILTLSDYNDQPLYKIKSLFRKQPNQKAGHTASLLYLLFVTYYFASGINKLTDISFLEWLQFDLAGSMHEYRIKAENGYSNVPYILEPLYQAAWLNYLGPPLVYISHLLTPIVFYWRHHVFKFFLFYAAFHFLTFGVGISFTGYVYVWLVLFPYHRLMFGQTERATA